MTDDVLRPARSTSTARFHRGHALGLAALVTPLAQAYSWPIVTPIMVLAALGVVIAVRGRLSRPPLILVGLLVVLAAYGAASGLWGLSDKLALKAAWTIIATAIPGLIVVAAARDLDRAERSWFEACLVAGFLIGLANMQILVLSKAGFVGWVKRLDFVEAVFGPPGSIGLWMLDTQMTLITLMIWPVFAVVRRRWGLIWAGVVAAAGLIVVAQSISGTAKLAYVVGFVALAFAWLRPRWSAALVGAGLVVWVAFAPVIHQSGVVEYLGHFASGMSARTANSMSHRRAIWDFAIARIHDRPVLGWGLDNSRIIPGGHDHISPGLELMPLHPHNGALQLRLELGIPGVLLGMIFVAWIALAVRRLASHPFEQALMVALVASITVNAAGGYHLWHVWWMTFLWLGAAFAIAAIRPDPADAGTFKPGPAAA